MTIMKVDGFPKTFPDLITEALLRDKKEPEPIKTITSFHIQSSDWDSIVLRSTSEKHMFYFLAQSRKWGTIEVMLDVSEYENPKQIVIERKGLSEQIDILLTEAIRVASMNYMSTQVRPYVTKLAITRYSFNTGICVQRFVDVTKSAAGNYVVPGYFHGVKPSSLGQFYNHGKTAEMISLPENLERDRHFFNKCMFRLIRRKTREIARQKQAEALKKAVDNPKTV